jgi:serpin B
MTRRHAVKVLSLIGLRTALPAGSGRAVERALTQDRAVAEATAAFGCDLYGKLRSRPGNLFFSPLSVDVALAILRLGARGESRAEMDAVIRLPLPRAHSGAGAFLNGLRGAPGSGYELSVANSLWLQQGLPFKKEFLDQSRMYFEGASLHSVDFGRTEEARQTINRWVEQQTRDRIKDLFARGTLSKENRLVVANAVYFKSRWADPFPKGATKDEPFHVTDDKTVLAPLMRRHGRYRYHEGGGVQAVELPYAGDRMTMLVVLPSVAASAEVELTAERLAAWSGKLRYEEGQVLLPRFKVADEFDLGETLQSMGMKRAFTRAADFGGICDEPLLISKVVHKAFVETNEEGTEAAAATGVLMPPKAARPEPEQPFTFRADRPFVFVIRDARTGTPVFIGRVRNPLV